MISKIGVIGSVGTTLTTIEALKRHKFNILGVLGFEPVNTKYISGFQDLRSFSLKNDILFRPYQDINTIENIKWMKDKKPDVIFAVGFSQILKDEWLTTPRLGCIGFHPTPLPIGRGRAPIAWTILDNLEGAVSLFLMEKDADKGPVFIQEKYIIEEGDDAQKIAIKINQTLRIALDKWLPKLKKGIWNPIPQNEKDATWYGKRNPEDGLIEWNQPATKIELLIRASTQPYPGAYTFLHGTQLKIWEASLENNLRIKGVVGRILLKNDKEHLLVQCGEGLLWIKKYTIESNYSIKIGDKLGYEPQIEIFKLWNSINKLKNE